MKSIIKLFLPLEPPESDNAAYCYTLYVVQFSSVQ